MLNCCNPLASDVISKSALLLVPDNDFTTGLLGKSGQYHLDLFVPGIGYIDSYSIGAELKKLAI